MISNRRKRNGLELGYDSFLDIVANLVGILIILVVVLGAQSTSRIEALKQNDMDSPTRNEATPAEIQELTRQAQLARAAENDSRRFEKLIANQKNAILAKQTERDLLLDLLSQAETAWNEAQEELDTKKLENAQRLTAERKLKSEIDFLNNEAKRLSNQPDQVVEIEHLPTPMAKTVFGEEVHLRLKENRLSVVPIEQLLEVIRKDFERTVHGNKEGRQESAVGPVRGYIARYQLAKERGTINRGGQIQTATRIQLVSLSVEPLSEPHGTPIEQVIQDWQLLDVELAGRKPESTTVTVWVYPDSFATFRTLKEMLYQKGFATAARPLPEGHVISGGPDGSRSQAQ